MGSHLHMSLALRKPYAHRYGVRTHYLHKLTNEDVTVCRVKRMTCRLKSGRGNSAVRPRSLREV